MENVFLWFIVQSEIVLAENGVQDQYYEHTAMHKML